MLGIYCAVVPTCHEFGLSATKALDLGGDVASVQGCGECVDAFREPFGPVVFEQGVGVGEMSALDIGKLEFAGVAEDPLGGKLRHGLDLVLSEDGIFGDGFEPAVVLWAKGHPLCVDDNRPWPEFDAIFAKDLGMFVFHELVDLGDGGWEVEGGGEDADAEVIVAQKVGVVRHGCKEPEQPLERFWLVQIQGLEAMGPDIVLVAMHLDSEVHNDAEIAPESHQGGCGTSLGCCCA